MAAQITTLKRTFTYNARVLPDPNESFSVEEVLDHYSSLHPQLEGGKVVQTGTTETEISYELRARFGEKG